MPTVRFAIDSGASNQDSGSGSDLGERFEQPDHHASLTPLGLLDFGGKGLNEPKLLDLSDEIRSHLLEDASLGPRAEMVKRVLRELVRDEGAAIPVVSLATIQNARLDKLLSDILTLGHQQASASLRPRLNIAMAERLQRSWVARFREDFFNIDQTRQEDLSKSSRLKDVELWKAAKCKTVSGLEWNLQFKPGYHKQNPQTRLHRIVVTLERISEQPSMTELAKIPLPSQMDDWLLFKRYEGEMIRQHRGEQSFLDWKLMKAQERMDRRQWRRALEVGAALTTARNARYSYGMRDLGLKQDDT
ncbi:hypothetical protein BBK36DRAFT_1167704 [Trichoderma citrinoviride]|uniref:Uncharacterized protein n=1 Tax=Trichoderma citrinoviride TaxID=58853 RepID=A0A2T4BDF2_9HYPO|nr:hypothetical protein BBK36DRAFT_1167704 [Trichoderma citrinoviride]PTB67298.1 hypothetical protein BBK36DRAFT_1167704 [Trichoderma citrinoviride]